MESSGDFQRLGRGDLQTLVVGMDGGRGMKTIFN
jgi:hypothetical protein